MAVFRCACGKQKNGQPFKSSGYFPFVCENCKKQRTQAITRTVIVGASKLMLTLKAHIRRET